jgi:hypothetical protein
MLPHSDNAPTQTLQKLIRVPIPFRVSAQFRPPPLPILFGHGLVLGTRVPKAAVDEHNHFRAREHDIDCACQLRNYATVKTETQSESMKRRAQLHLHGGISLPHRSHPSARAERGCHRISASFHPAYIESTWG